MIHRSPVRADGTTSLPGGIYDMTTAPQDDLDPELDAKIKKLAAAFDPRETKAQFKLELFFAGGPRRMEEVKGVAAFWTNGGHLNGQGDLSVYLCPQILSSGKPCLEPIDVGVSAGGKVVCTRCRRLSTTKALVGQILLKATMQRWATVTTHLFHVLHCNADIRICVERESIQRAAEDEFARDRGGEEYEKVAQNREWITYPLANIIKDTASGAGLESRIRAFLEA